MTKADFWDALGFEVLDEIDDFLKAHDVYEPCGFPDLEQERRDLERLGFFDLFKPIILGRDVALCQPKEVTSTTYRQLDWASPRSRTSFDQTWQAHAPYPALKCYKAVMKMKLLCHPSL